MNEISKQVGKRIRELRKARNLSQEELGEIGGLHYSYIGQAERGEKNISLSNLEKIANALDVALHQLFVFSLDTEKFVESEVKIKEILILLQKLSEDDVRKLHKAIIVLFGDEKGYIG